jgi:hypothetical protein
MILNILVRRGAMDSWEQSVIVDTAAATISRADEALTSSGEYERLRTALLERGVQPPAHTTGQESTDDADDGTEED